MAGYIMTIGADEYLDLFYKKAQKGKVNYDNDAVSSKKEAEKRAKLYALQQCILKGVYSAKTAEKGASFIGTLADYLGMKPGDDIFFFTERKIYGIGRLIKIADVDCRFRIKPIGQGDSGKNLITGEKRSEKYKFICTFEPAPRFFKNGVDMDEVLMFSPEKIRSLRFFSQMTFIKLDDVESEAIKSVIVRKNEEYIECTDKETYYEYSKDVHMNMEKELIDNAGAYELSVFDYIRFNKRVVTSEYYLEGAIMDLLREEYRSKSLGRWDFIGRQYPASPPKPSEYKEAMDLFGYRYVRGFSNVISKYLVIELKTETVKKEHVQQTMKYVDWVSREYAKGDYSMIEAYTIGYDMEKDLEENMIDIVERNYIIEGHPVENKKWSQLRIISYYTLLEELAEKQGREFESNE